MNEPIVRPFTSRTRVALAIARSIAAARGDRDLTATHIAAGIFREGANAALGAVWYAGLPEAAIKGLGAELENSLGERTGRIAARVVAIDTTPGEEAVVDLADVEASRFQHPYLGAEHILLAILRSDQAVSGRLSQYGITVEKYESGLRAMLRGDAPPNASTAV
jgi:ATP-dependent Clp protease ATP-binding subunit ClpA